MASRARRRRSRARALMRGGLTAGLVAAGACDSLDAAREPDAAAPVATSAGAGAGAASMPPGALAGSASPPILVAPQPVRPIFPADQVVELADPPRRVLYSWTTEEQYAELRDSPVLLTRSERPGQGGGVLRQVLAELAAAGDPLSMALGAPEFEKTRYAWPNPWATLLGWPGESYGNQLIRIELRQDAWVMVLIGTEWQVVDLDGAQVPRADAIATPERIGAVFHVHQTDGLGCQGSFLDGGSGGFREYALLNESMISRWSLATAEMRQRLEADIAALESYRAYFAAGGIFYTSATFEASAACAWQDQTARNVDALDTESRYMLALALASPAYEPSVTNLDALIAALEGALFEPDPIVRTAP